MALAIKFCKLSSLSFLKNKGYLYNTVRCISDEKPLPWNYLWEPGKYSKENHDKIAEKYHMHPKDYKPCPEEWGMGDYPDLPMIGPGAKDPYYPYDFPVYRKNYHEIVHYQFDMMTEDRHDFGVKERINPAIGALIFLAIIGGFIGLYILTDPYYAFEPLMEKQYPYRGKIYYTFEPQEK
ncbi:NADH dehydrogenase [ubiquinone] 1 beta subcomplex subunit 8, mitochondrial [Odontomachus brunneus]|uniref:NADH dehydrogenase [ubiquinone] 1 beta subcomplex subunit 8, mitochondrial n=1 Tax=Odontomachus brunneus TaxID=486640 RepID=UPI0013F1CD96|nr:NADH dehydrogenase [ubiquinone] 1 beta subcomplex subunit 8, mitochondrial [Odontomachus brunneus]